MGMNAAQKILSSHLVSGRMAPGEEIAIRIDQTLTQDATGTMAYLQFEAMGVPRVKTELSVSYVDHNTLQTGFENADEHCRKARPLLLPPGKRHLPPSSSGTLRRAGKDAPWI
jgi:homoaconitase/3-isopropylmalate dehydratase large subunit